MHIQAITSCNSAGHYSEVSLVCTDTPLLLYELIGYLRDYCVDEPQFSSMIFDKEKFEPIEKELYSKWSDKNFLSLLNPIYNYCFMIEFDEIKEFFSRLNEFLLADIFYESFFWKELQPYLIGLVSAFGEWCFSDPNVYFSTTLDDLPAVKTFIDNYAISPDGVKYYSCDDSRISNDIRKFMEYNRDMDYAYRHGIYPCALLSAC